MRFILKSAVIVAAIVPGAANAQWDNASYTAPRNATVDAGGAKRIDIEASAGFLRVKGVSGSQVRITGVARASRQNLLSEIRLVAERRGDAVFIKADIEDRNNNWGNNNDYRGLDLTIEVPSQIALDIEDGSGEIEIVGTAGVRLVDGSGAIEMENIGGAVDIDDGSGEIQMRNIRGNVAVSDGSGEIVARGVTGNLTVEEDGSGAIEAYDVSGSFVVRNDGSGGIKADGVGGDLDVRSKGSGSVNYYNVKGTVRVPDDERRSRRNRY